MERLTKRINGIVVYIGKYKKYEAETSAELECDAVREVLERLADYEDGKCSAIGAMCKTVTALQLARYVLQYTTKNNIRIVHLQLQKILYYIQGYHLHKFGRPLFNDKIKAWKYGPVIVSVYNKYFIQGALPLRAENEATLDVTLEQQSLIDEVIKRKVLLRGAQLVTATRAESPWRDLKSQVEAGFHPTMTVDAIKKYFDNLVV